MGDFVSCDGPGEDYDWYAFTVPGGMATSATITFMNSVADLDLSLFDAADPAVSLTSSSGTGDAETVNLADRGTDRDLLLRVRNFSGRNGAGINDAPYALAITLTIPPCVDDSREENDTEATASILGNGTVMMPVGTQSFLNSLQACSMDADYYRFTTTQAGPAFVDARYDPMAGDLTTTVFAMGLEGMPLAMSSTFDPAVNGKRAEFMAMAATEYFVRVDNPAAMGRVAYSMGAGGAAICPDDTYEPNNAAPGAANIVLAGALTQVTGLVTCSDGAEDWYSINVPAGAGARVNMLFTDATSDLDLFLYDAADPSTSLDSSASTSDNESVEVGQVTADSTLLVRVVNYSNLTNTYSFNIEVVAGGLCQPDSGEQDDTAATGRSLNTAGGSVNNRTACLADPDFYRFTVPTPSATTRLAVTYMGAPTDLTVNLTEDGQTTALGTRTNVGMGRDVIEFSSTMGVTYVLEVTYAGSGGGTSYGVQLLNAGVCTDDGSEDNDDQNTATVLMGRTQTMRQACEADPDYYRFTPTTAGDATVLVTYDNTTGNLAGSVFALGGEASPIGVTGPYNAMLGGRTISLSGLVAGEPLYLRVTNTAGEGRVTYGFSLTGDALCVDDDSEPNDAVSMPALLSGASVTNRILCGTNPDYFSFAPGSAGVGTQVVVSVDTGGAVDVALFDSTGAAVTATEQRMDNDVTLVFDSAMGQTYVLALSNAAGTGESTYDIDVVGAPPSNDTCATAIALTDGAMVTGDTSLGSSAVSFTTTSCTGYGNLGPDLIYSVSIPAGATLTATLDSASDLALWLVEDCVSRCCWGGADEETGGTPEVLVFTNPTAAALDLLLGVDGWLSSSQGAFSLSVSIQ